MHPQPLVYLRDKTFVNLTAMVDFIYTREVSILQDHLESFPAFAEELELRGLGENSEEDASKKPKRNVHPKGGERYFFENGRMFWQKHKDR